MSKHTKGPWFDDGYRIHAPTDNADKRSGRVIVEYKHIDDFNDADASLIAAAPDLLEALKRCLNWLSSYPGGCSLGTYDQARAAIAKAEGKK